MPSVLQIDSDPVSSTRMERVLRAAGYSTTRAHSGLDGLETARRNPPDLVIVSSPLPDLDAHVVTLRLRELPGWSDRAIVIVDDTRDAQAAVAVGASGHVRRDTAPALLVRDVGRYLRGVRESPDQSSEIRLRDFSQRMAADLELRLRALLAANRDLEHLARVRTEFLRNVSHELATPITPALGYVELLRSEATGPLTDEQRTILDSLSASLDRLLHVTGVLREVSAFENNELKPRFTTFNLDRFAKSFDETWRVARANVHVDRANAQRDVFGDAALLGRSLRHVVENAFKFGGADVSVFVRFEVTDEWATLTIVDSGPGIPTEQLGRLGDLFHQLDGSPTRRHGGVGLGLAYVRRVMGAHDGTLRVVSPPVTQLPDAPNAGVGTEVRLRWPRLDVRSK